VLTSPLVKILAGSEIQQIISGKTFERYLNRARGAAELAIQEAGVLPSATKPFSGISQLFHAIKKPSPVQSFTETTESVSSQERTEQQPIGSDRRKSGSPTLLQLLKPSSVWRACIAERRQHAVLVVGEFEGQHWT
jgi:hypothetical protein